MRVDSKSSVASRQLPDSARARAGGWRRRDDRGQTMIFILLALGLFLIGAVGFTVDIANLWFHRQAVQNAADAACTASAMDLLFAAESVPVPGTETAWGGLTPGTGTFDCAKVASAAPCQYAALNGYNGSGIVAGTGSNSVKFSFPAASALPAIPSGSSPPAGTTMFIPSFMPYPLIQVNVGEAVRVIFAGMMTGQRTLNVSAMAICGVVEVQSPVPLLVLDPRNETSVTNKGAFTIDIYGGPQKSIQVNSISTSAVGISGAAGNIDLSKGGPTNTGSSFGVTGAQASVSDLTLGTTGQYTAPDSPLSDPLATMCAPGETAGCITTSNNGSTAPGIPAAAPAVGSVGPGVDGCPTGGGNCQHYQAGSYAGGISVKNNTAVFDPGLYYVTGGMALQANSLVCTGTGVAPYVGDGSKGVTFYFADGNSVSVVANSGSGQCTNSAGTALTGNDIRCSGASTLPGNMAATQLLAGNILLAPCTGYYGDPLGANDPGGEQRGILFFQDRSVSASPQWGGGGAFTLAGTMYFHYCDSSTLLSGENCNATSGYTDLLELGGGSCSGTYVLGNITVDQLYLHGNPCLNMDLNPAAAYYLLKASLLQ